MLDQDAIAALLKVTKQALGGLLHRGTLVLPEPVYNVNNRKFYDKEAIMDWLETRPLSKTKGLDLKMARAWLRASRDLNKDWLVYTQPPTKRGTSTKVTLKEQFHME